MLLSGSMAKTSILAFCGMRSAAMSFFIAGVLVLVLILVGCGSGTTPSKSPDPDNSAHRGPDPDVPPPMDLDPDNSAHRGPDPDVPPPMDLDPDNSTHRGPDPDVPPPMDPDPRDPALQSVIHTTRLGQSITFNIQDGDPLNDRILRQPQQGMVILNADGSVTYSPAPGAVGEDSFEIEINGSPREITINNNLAYVGQIDGRVNSFGNVEVLLTGDGVLETASPDASGRFKFYALPDGDYVIKVRKAGYTSSLARAFGLDIRQHDPLRDGIARFALEAIDSDAFVYHWEEDQSAAGYDYAAHVNQPVVVEFLDEQVEVADEASASQLHHDYNILLVDSESGSWTQEHAYRLLETMKSVPQKRRDPYKEQSLPASKWLLTSDHLEDDIQIAHHEDEDYRAVLISEDAFVNASPRIARAEGKRGVYYSQRLHHALVRFVTDNGRDEAAYEGIFQSRYGVTTRIPDYAELTSSTTSESASRFQEFHPEEIVQLINMFEEMPKGMHKLPELQYLVRRLDGTPHPIYPAAPAVAWPDYGYIEFMESGFSGFSAAYVHRLIIHEKAHFLWAHWFDEQLKQDWIELGGWYHDPGSPSGWSTSKQTEFVSAYAHLENPNEDMAESIAYFIVNPDKLKSRAIGKYEFVRDRTMQGNIYISTIREGLTFEVYNLYPDYVFPGKIRRVDIMVEGEPENDKTIHVEIELHALDEELEGAKRVSMRIFSETGTFVDLYLYPMDVNGNRLTQGTVLKGSFALSKHAKAGYWRTNQIVITDAVGNERFEGVNDFGWKLYVSNLLEDVTAPEYVGNTASLSKSVTSLEGQEVQLIHATWEVDEDTAMRERGPCYASLNDDFLQTYRYEEHGLYDSASRLCQVDFIMPHYMPSSIYRMNYISMIDEALNKQGVYFTHSGHALRPEESIVDENPQQIELETNNPDLEPPELDINDIQISAEPTYPDAPNGETLVTTTFRVRDNISGYKIASVELRDPQGIKHQGYHYHAGRSRLFPEGDPTHWTTYTRTVLLPPGSAPGTWGLAEMTIRDRAGNFQRYDFTEIIHFDVY